MHSARDTWMLALEAIRNSVLHSQCLGLYKGAEMSSVRKIRLSFLYTQRKLGLGKFSTAILHLTCFGSIECLVHQRKGLVKTLVCLLVVFVLKSVSLVVK